MKIITVNSQARFGLIADSALTLPGRPTFLPDLPEAHSWGGEISVAVRISRLGKSIAPKFAPRYFDALSLAFRLLPLDADGLPLDRLADVMDFALTLGRWIPKDDSLQLRIALAGAPTGDATDAAAIARAITDVSRIATLKMGDIILLPIAGMPQITVATGTKIEAELGQERLLDFTIK